MQSPALISHILYRTRLNLVITVAADVTVLNNQQIWWWLQGNIWWKLEQLEHLHSEIPSTVPWFSILVIHFRSEVKTRQIYNFKKIAKNTIFKILQETLQATHLLMLLDKMYKYEMDPTKTVGATERTRDVGQTDGQTDGQSETSIPPQQLCCAGEGGIIIFVIRYFRYICTHYTHNSYIKLSKTFIKSLWPRTPFINMD